MKILVVAHHFPPENTVGSLRPYSWVKYWTLLGHDVTVVTTTKYRFDAPPTLNLSFQNNTNIQVFEINYLSSNNQVDINQNLPDSSQSKSQTIKRVFRGIRDHLKLGALISVRHLWIYPAVKKIISLHQLNAFDVIVSTYGPPACHLIAFFVKQKYPDILWAADYRDLWCGDDAVERNVIVDFLERNIEKKIVKKANLLFTVSQGLKSQLEKLHERKVNIIENGFDVEDRVNQKFYRRTSSDKIHIAYTGTIHFSHQNIEPLLLAIRYLSERKIISENNFLCSLYGAIPSEVETLITVCKVSNVVKTCGLVDRKKSLEIQQTVDALVFLDWVNSTNSGVLTGKIFEYMYSGTPILGIGSTESTAAGQLIQEAGVGICLGEFVEKIEEVLQKLINGENLSYSPKAAVLAMYERKTLANKMLSFIENEYQSLSS